MTELRPGLELAARFSLVRRLGRGGNGEVWLADDRHHDRQVALKALSGDWLAEPGRRELLEREFTRARALPAAVSVPVLELLEADSWILLVSEYQPGGDLGQFRGRSFVTWVAAAEQVCAALELSHAAGIVHRDLRCANVLLDSAGRARLADFGLAALAAARAPAGESPYHASPQQLRGEPAVAADDLYGLGALLYELIAGHPPYYPDISRERVLHEPVPPLQPRAKVPVRVRELVLRLLSKAASERPGLAAVRATLARARDDEPEQAPAHEITAAKAAVTPRAQRRWLPLAVVAVAAAALAVFLWLPDLVAGRSARLAEMARSSAESAVLGRNEAERLATERAAASAAADAARTGFDQAWKAAEERNASRWATDLFAAAREQGAEAAQRYAVGEFAAAQSAWEAGSKLLTELDAARPGALAGALREGAAALQRGDLAAGREAYALALSIQPDHVAALAGKARAGRLEQAFAAMDAAAAEERAGRHEAAAAGYRRALAIDAEAPGARQALSRLQSRQTGDAYAATMSQGFAHLAAGRNAPARAAFERALTLRPGAAEATEALAQLDQGQRAAALALLESRARAAEAEEAWSQAVAAWQEASRLEPALVAAREGLARSVPRAELAASMDALIQKPERLWTPAGRSDARALVATARAASPPKLRATSQALELEALIAAAETPVRLRLESDGLTNVVIYRVGRLGLLASQVVELLPGRYVVVGTRGGYRDIRREVEIRPGVAPAPVVVRCEERI